MNYFIMHLMIKQFTNAVQGGGGGGDLYSRLRSGNTFAFLEPVHRLVLCHLHVGFQV